MTDSNLTYWINEANRYASEADHFQTVAKEAGARLEGMRIQIDALRHHNEDLLRAFVDAPLWKRVWNAVWAR